MRSVLTILAIAPFVLSGTATFADTPLLTAQPPIEIPGGGAHFDFMNFDTDTHRVLACHPGGKELVILDTTTNAVTKIETGEVNGVGIDPVENRYFTAGANQDVVVIDRLTLKKVADIPVTGPADDVIYNPTNGLVYVDHDDGTEVWVIDPKTDKITGTVTVAGAPEVMEYDAASNRIYQNIKPANEVQVIDPATKAVVADWPTGPVESPHGLAIAVKRRWVLSAGKNGKLAALDMSTGKVASSCDIKPGVDQIAYDAGAKRLYCGCKGFISVVKVSKKGLTNEGDVPSAGGHSVTVNPETHTVWIAYNDDTHSYLQAFTSPAAKAAMAQ